MIKLYNLAEDIGEEHDLAATMPEKREELLQALHAWQADVGAQSMTPNPNYDPEKRYVMKSANRELVQCGREDAE